ncbi:LytR/AlgR family response regulator transcription factor [Eubacterium aggregans]|uniref:LytR/AlgR family response regulator transcription factor n=1 Tax=Eubacterium aggregans TaxID=81409 RepID=UPI003F2F65AF
MKILVIDNETASLNILVRAIEGANPNSELRYYSKTSEALKVIESQAYIPDVVFTDIEMPGMTGLELALILKKYNPYMNIVFVTGFSEYALRAIELRSSGYILKPATVEKIRDELENLRSPLKQSNTERIFIQCFGNFEVFVAEGTVHFSRMKSKEMLAFLVNRRGANCASAEIANVLWDDGKYNRSRQKQLSVIRQDLIKSLTAAGVEKIIKKGNGTLAVDITKFSCDYYQAVAGDVRAINTFLGEYMMPFTWAEFTTGFLVSKYTCFND